MALSKITVLGDGATTEFAIPFALGYIKEADVTARVGTEVDGLGAPVYRPLTFNTPGMAIVGGPVVANTVPIVFTRTVDRDSLEVDFEDGDILTGENLNIAQKQSLMLAQEALDGRFAPYADDIDLNDHRIHNVLDPLVSDDAATKNYVDQNTGGAMGWAAAAQASAILAGSYVTTTAASATAAANSAILAQDWAARATDSAVPGGGGLFSARHYSVKAAADRAAINAIYPTLTAPDAFKLLQVNAAGNGIQLITPSGSTGIIVVANRAALKALNPVSTTIAYLSVAGRAGTFIVAAGTAPLADTAEGIYITSSTSGYYWIRVFTGPANIFWFGASGKGTIDDALTVTAALATSDEIYLPAQHWDGTVSNFRFSTSITLGQNKTIIGDPGKTQVTLVGSMAVDVFIIVGSFVSIFNLKIIGSFNQTNTVFRMDTTAVQVQFTKIQNCTTFYCYQVYGDMNVSNIFTHFYAIDNLHIQSQSRGVLFRKGRAFIFFTNVAWDYVGVVAASSNLPIVALLGNEGAIFTNCDILGGTRVGMAARSGFYVETSAAVWFIRCMADTMGGAGFYLKDVDYAYLDTCTASLCWNGNLEVNTGSRYITVSNCYFGGAATDGGPGGVPGILIASSGPVTITGGFVVDCTAAAIVTTGTNSLIASGMQFRGNTGNYNLAAGAIVSRCILNNGSLLDAGIGPAIG